MKNIMRFTYRMLNPLLDPKKFFAGIYGYFWYFRDLFKYSKMERGSRLFGLNMHPMLHDKTSLTPIDAHYFYQQIWLFQEVNKKRPSKHVDVGSIHDVVGVISTVVPTDFVDIRPIDVELKNLTSIKGSILDLPYVSESVESLSCLHVAEHIGLGRYGDEIDPEGFVKSCAELKRILKPGGLLYFSTPIGVQRVCFNAHRISSPSYVLGCFNGLELVSFNAVDDDGKYVRNANVEQFEGQSYGLGMFKFTKE